ncbi:hypothetical protein MNBD_GAMMA10-2470 [hydrothermal vent metagenome]|uniref:Phosphotyrosine protein phosphatase I domain-containing protein n=1 Tax=hydrothermal vent metagenome TaxID=652676 RepID=A0A3B0XFK8_9ZZZZ
MKRSSVNDSVAVSIWLLALGYFIFYAPYSALTKALTSGSLSSSESISGIELLPFVLLGTVITMPLIIYFLGWYRYFNRYQIKKNGFPWPGRWAIFSGVSFSVIIATTTLAYSFQGVSIVFALLLMRGGVLVLSPLIDFLSRQKVHWYSWIGLILSLVAVAVALGKVDEYSLDWIVLLNLAGYLTAYMFRLHFMTHYAKDAHESLNRQFFVEENIVSMFILVICSLLLLFYYTFISNVTVISYIDSAISSGVVWPALLIGVLYGVLGIFGSLIYLNRRENTFSIPVNRCSSLLSGVLASFVLAFLYHDQSVSTTQVISALLIVTALIFMSLFDYIERHKYGNSDSNPFQKVWLFICDGNRMRSPMAAAICNKALESYAPDSTNVKSHEVIYADSAALALGDKRLMPDAAKHALSELGISSDNHRAKQVTRKQMRGAEKVFCMSSEQRADLIKKFPWIAPKVYILGGEVEIRQPLEEDKHNVMDLAHCLNEHIHKLILAISPEPANKSAELNKAL